MKDKLRQAFEAIKGTPIPEIPEEVIQLEAILRSKFPNLVEVANIIEKNTVLSGETLKLINSPALKLKDPVKSIREAVNRLGLDNIYNLIIASALKNLFNKSGLVKDITDNSVDVAFCMAELSEYIHGISRDEAYMLGLFHNIGAIMLANKSPEKYGTLYSNALSNPYSVIAKEEALFGSNHCVIGVLVSQKWKLPIHMINAIYLHHTKNCQTIQNDEVRAMVAMLQLANAIVSEISLGAYISQEAKQYYLNGAKELMIDNKVLQEIRSNLMTYAFKS